MRRGLEPIKKEYRIKQKPVENPEASEQVQAEKKKKRKKKTKAAAESSETKPEFEYKVKVSDRNDDVLQKPKVTQMQIPEEAYQQCKTPEEQKQFLGNYLYQWVFMKMNRDLKAKNDEEYQKLTQENGTLNQRLHELSGRITGIMLDGQTVDFLRALCKNQKAFEQMVEEASTLIKNAEGKLF